MLASSMLLRGFFMYHSHSCLLYDDPIISEVGLFATIAITL